MEAKRMADTRTTGEAIRTSSSSKAPSRPVAVQTDRCYLSLHPGLAFDQTSGFPGTGFEY